MNNNHSSLKVKLQNIKENTDENNSTLYRVIDLIGYSFATLVLAVLSFTIFVFPIIFLVDLFILHGSLKPVIHLVTLGSLIILWVIWFIFTNSEKSIQLSYYDQLKIVNRQLNKPFIDANDNEKVCLLHELIEQYDLVNDSKLNKQLYLDQINFEINVDQSRFVQFNEDQYRDENIYHLLKNEVIPLKELQVEDTKDFFMQHIQPFLENEHFPQLSIDEKEKQRRQLLEKNQL